MSNVIHFGIPYYDNHGTALRSALIWCEEYCIAICCGMRAFNITLKNMQEWADRVSQTEVDDARRQTSEILSLLKDAPPEFLFLGDPHFRDVVAGWFETIQETLADVKPGGPAPST